MTESGPRLFDALSLLSETAEEIVLHSVRDTHLAWAERVHGVTRRATGGSSTVPETLHRGIASAVYAGIGGGLRAASVGFDKLAAAELGPHLESHPRGRFVSSAVNGLIGDTLLRDRPQMAIPMALRLDGHDVEPTREALASAYSVDGGEPSGQLVVFLHGLCENESYWRFHRDRTGTSYPEALAEAGWAPLLTRANTGLGLRENGVALTALLQRVVEEWPVPVTRIVLVGHSMGGLIIRAAGAVSAVEPELSWTRLVSDVVTLGTPHLGAPVAWGVGHGATGLGALPETAAFGRILDRRSVGVRDLVLGLAEDVPALPHARYRLVCATLSENSRSPLGHLVGDLLVRPRSAYGRSGKHRVDLFPGATRVHVGRTDHFGLLNHPQILAALRDWLG